MTSLALSVGGTSVANVSLGYDNANRETSITRTIGGTGNSISTTIGYDNADRLTSISHSSSVAGTLMSLTYGYDAASRVTSYTGPEGTLNYGYDNTNELTSVTGARSESYGYDLNGNRNTTGYTTTTGNRMTSDGTYNYTFDNEGNVLTKTRISDSEKWTFTWDYRNRLTDIVEKTSGGTTVLTDHFTYDVLDHRIGKSVNSTTTWTLYAGDTPYSDFNSSGAVLERYLADPKAIDNFFARYDGTTTAWYLQDMLSSVREIVKTDGTVLDQLTYDSYGNILSETNASNGDRFKFAGMQWDSEIGQYYAWHRHYLPGPGRFGSEDPFAFQASDMNLYRYVGNDAVMLGDPTGLGTKDPRFGLPNEFWDWIREQGGKGKPKYHKMSFEEAMEAYEEFLEQKKHGLNDAATECHSYNFQLSISMNNATSVGLTLGVGIAIALGVAAGILLFVPGAQGAAAGLAIVAVGVIGGTAAVSAGSGNGTTTQMAAGGPPGNDADRRQHCGGYGAYTT